MATYLNIFLIALICPAAIQAYWLTDGLAFLETQKNKIVNSTMNVKNSISNYFNKQKDKFTNGIDSYVDGIKETGRQIEDVSSYLSGNAEPQVENPDVKLTVPAIIARHGYKCETHVVISQGYILNVHRISHTRHGTSTPSRTILLQHGLFGSSADWILNGPEKALAYVLADAGYDVWMTNIRGNRYSKSHVWLKTDSKAYWNFSWHDVALYDIPEVIDYIIGLKGSGTKIAYMGHSMGTTLLFTMLTLRPEYNDVLTTGFALAPAVFFTNMKSPIKSLAPLASSVAYMESMYGSHEFIPKDSVLGKLSGTCSVDKIDVVLCKNVLFYVCGINEKQFNRTVLPVFLSHLGTGTSWKTAVHFAQEVISGKYQQFDYGADDNSLIYGSESPPEYDLSKVTLPIKLYWSKNDLISSEEDVKLLRNKLPGVVDMYLVPDPEFNHIDYLWAIDAPSLLNDDVVGSFNKAFMASG